MKKLVSTLCLASLGVVAACSQESSDAQNQGGTRLRAAGVALVDENSDVTKLAYTIRSVDCDTGAQGDVVATSLRGLEDQVIPGNLASLADKPFVATSEHLFADYFQTLAPGCYSVEVTPMKDDVTASEICVGAKNPKVLVASSKTTEILLVSQCKTTDPGAIDAIAALNHEPQLVDAKFVDSKFICGAPAVFCAKATDADNDTLRYDFIGDGGACSVGETFSGTGEQLGYSCAQITCPAPGRTEVTVKIYDLAKRLNPMTEQVEDVTIEQWLADNGGVAAAGNDAPESHAQLTAPIYFDGVVAYPDVDEDTYGSNNPTLFCSNEEATQAGYVFNHDDCDDTAAAVNPGVIEEGTLCGDLIDNDCSGADRPLISWYPDADGDAFGSHSATALQLCEGIDPNAGYSEVVVTKVTNNSDCDDSNAAVHPGNGTCGSDCGENEDEAPTYTAYLDVDADTFGSASLTFCSAQDATAAGYTATVGGDCNPSDSAIYPGAQEVCQDGVDQDCNGLDYQGDVVAYADHDSDGHGNVAAPAYFCSVETIDAGYTQTQPDCNDENDNRWKKARLRVGRWTADFCCGTVVVPVCLDWHRGRCQEWGEEEIINVAACDSVDNN